MIPRTLLHTVLLFATSTFALTAAETYQASLKLGDDLRKSGDFDAAVTEYGSAHQLAGNDTERALALAKKGFVQAFDQKDYDTARQSADAALALSPTGAIAKASALQVLAECEMKGDRNYGAAITHLEEALELQGVDFIQPTLALVLGDAYRLSARFGEAIAAYQRILDMTAANDAIKAVAYLNMGITSQYNLRDSEKAREYYQTAVGLKPDLKGEVDGHLATLP